MIRRTFIGAMLGLLGITHTEEPNAEVKPLGLTGRQLLEMPEFRALCRHIGLNLDLPIVALEIYFPEGLIDYVVAYAIDPDNMVRPGLQENVIYVTGFSFYRDPIFLNFVRATGFDWFGWTKEHSINITSLDSPALFLQRNAARALKPPETKS